MKWQDIGMSGFGVSNWVKGLGLWGVWEVESMRFREIENFRARGWWLLLLLLLVVVLTPLPRYLPDEFNPV